ncbi:unnamed protein product, partial [Meganyctiphanes norvegica]
KASDWRVAAMVASIAVICLGHPEGGGVIDRGLETSADVGQILTNDAGRRRCNKEFQGSSKAELPTAEESSHNSHLGGSQATEEDSTDEELSNGFTVSLESGSQRREGIENEYPAIKKDKAHLGENGGVRREGIESEHYAIKKDEVHDRKVNDVDTSFGVGSKTGVNIVGLPTAGESSQNINHGGNQVSEKDSTDERLSNGFTITLESGSQRREGIESEYSAIKKDEDHSRIENDVDTSFGERSSTGVNLDGNEDLIGAISAPGDSGLYVEHGDNIGEGGFNFGYTTPAFGSSHKGGAVGIGSVALSGGYVSPRTVEKYNEPGNRHDGGGRIGDIYGGSPRTVDTFSEADNRHDGAGRIGDIYGGSPRTAETYSKTGNRHDGAGRIGDSYGGSVKRRGSMATANIHFNLGAPLHRRGGSSGANGVIAVAHRGGIGGIAYGGDGDSNIHVGGNGVLADVSGSSRFGGGYNNHDVHRNGGSSGVNGVSAVAHKGDFGGIAYDGDSSIHVGDNGVIADVSGISSFGGGYYNQDDVHRNGGSSGVNGVSAVAHKGSVGGIAHDGDSDSSIYVGGYDVIADVRFDGGYTNQGDVVGIVPGHNNYVGDRVTEDFGDGEVNIGELNVEDRYDGKGDAGLNGIDIVRGDGVVGYSVPGSEHSGGRDDGDFNGHIEDVHSVGTDTGEYIPVEGNGVLVGGGVGGVYLNTPSYNGAAGEGGVPEDDYNTQEESGSGMPEVQYNTQAESGGGISSGGYSDTEVKGDDTSGGIYSPPAVGGESGSGGTYRSVNSFEGIRKRQAASIVRPGILQAEYIAPDSNDGIEREEGIGGY